MTGPIDGRKAPFDARAPVDEGGEAPCMLHLLADPIDDIADRDDVERFVRDFYRQAAMDDVLGPVFEAASLNWSAHIETLVDFWSWQLFGVRGYEGNPLRAHEPLHRRLQFTAVHYERWLDLFEGTIDSLFVGPIAELAKARGRKMASALARLLDGATADGTEPGEVLWTAAP
jgi:hemoglobin